MRVIDLHTHPIFLRAGRRRADVDRLVAESRARGVVRMVVLGDVLVHGRTPDAGQIARINDETARVVRMHPDFFLGFCYLNPLLGARAVEREVERCVAGYDFRGLKLELANNALHPSMTPVMRLAARLSLPVLQHTWRTRPGPERRQQSDPEDTVALARRFPGVQVIMAHLTACGYRGVLEAKGVDNLVIDTSAAFPEAEILEYAVAQLGAERVVYGSDLPIREPAVTLGRVLGSRLTAAERRLILHDNAQRLLRLSPPC
ncbi:MAG: amidohydrolase family protein [Opitutae bacterium]|nr:amidohydrolase family protein [Opitutae bacterium]